MDNVRSDDETTQVFKIPSTRGTPGRRVRYEVLLVWPVALLLAYFLWPDDQPEQVAIALLTGAAIGLLIRLARSRRSQWSTSYQVGVTPTGMILERGKTTLQYAWNQIGFATVEEVEFTQYRCLSVFSPAGRRLFWIPDLVEHFEALCDAALARIKMAWPDTDERLRQRELRRKRFRGCLFAALGVSCGVMIFMSSRWDELLQLFVFGWLVPVCIALALALAWHHISRRANWSSTK